MPRDDAATFAQAHAATGAAAAGPHPRLVDVAIDAVGPAGGRTFSYSVPPRLADVAPGEAVLVEFGRRQALGIVLAEQPTQPDVETKPILARVRSDGPLLPALQLALARFVAQHYLAPPALVVRQLLPVGLLERVELVARSSGSAESVGSGSTDDLIAAIRDGGRAGVAVDDLPRQANRATLLRRLRALEHDGAIELEWRVRPPEAREKVERLVSLTEQGRQVAAALGGGEPSSRRPLGERQRALLAELLEADAAVSAARLAERHGGSAIPGLRRRGLVDVEQAIVVREPLAGRAESSHAALPAHAELTPAQRQLVERVAALSDERRHAGFLVEGVTASGKTAVYAGAIARALRAGRGALVLVPEIALAVPLLDRLARDLQVPVALLHSALSEGERGDEWRRIRSGEARVVVGTRLAVLAPLADPGVIVVDEEHDAAYKSDRTPRYQARDVALELGRLAGAPVLLGSATPDVVSVGRAQLGEIDHVRLPDRVVGRRPEVRVVDLRAELAQGNRGLLSEPLVEALGSLDRQTGERAILLINRRGSASVVICRDCGYVQVCPECQRPLVFHAAALALRCHHCGASAPVARRCPACDSPRIRYLGGGTERVEREVNVRFPDYRVARLDRDVVERKGAATRVVDAFAGGELDVLVGTALVAKGLDVPEVTLVGIVSADIALNLPDERSAERTYQLLVQAIGRAGRGAREGKALVQTYLPDHPAIQAAVTGDHAEFYSAELASRRLVGSPPFGRLIKLTIALDDRGKAEQAAVTMVETLRARAAESSARVDVLGPAPAYIARRAGRWRFNVVLRGDDPVSVLGGDPGPPWSVDIDPESLL